MSSKVCRGSALTSLEAGASGGAQPSAGMAAGMVVSFIQSSSPTQGIYSFTATTITKVHTGHVK
ncbi:hypothetical protein GCM10010317_062840 [Streptomyces mirabilis]|nr:hypothetical protein GCM10010317_062840 [Streptomyces mirabilis]